MRAAPRKGAALDVSEWMSSAAAGAHALAGRTGLAGRPVPGSLGGVLGLLLTSLVALGGRGTGLRGPCNLRSHLVDLVGRVGRTGLGTRRRLSGDRRVVAGVASAVVLRGALRSVRGLGLGLGLRLRRAGLGRGPAGDAGSLGRLRGA